VGTSCGRAAGGAFGSSAAPAWTGRAVGRFAGAWLSLLLMAACGSRPSAYVSSGASDAPGADAGSGGGGGDAFAGESASGHGSSGTSGAGSGQQGGPEDVRDDGGVAQEASGLPAYGGAADSPLTVTRLRCDLHTNPLQVQTITPRLTWELEAADASVRGEAQTSFEVLVASSAEKLAAGAGDLWASGVIHSSATRTVYAGSPLSSLTHGFWKVRVADAEGRLSPWSDAAEWTQGLLGAADWGGAQWLTAAAAAPLPLFRHEFTVSKSVERALVSVCGLGQYEIRINGTNISDAVMDPGWTNFATTCQYRTFDATAAVAEGANAIGVLLGNGMYDVTTPADRYAKFTGSSGPLKVIVHVLVSFSDGTQSAVVTDTTWRTAPGPISFVNIYGGEDFDARAEPLGWDQPGFSDAAWSPATAVTTTAPALVAQGEPPVKVMQEYPSVAVTQPQSGVFVYDLGQNFSGWPSIQVMGAAGAAVRLTPGENLGAAGTVSQASMGGPIWFTYTLRGGAIETWHPRFAYTGFRYLQVDGAVPAANAAQFPTRPQIVGVTGQFLHSSAEQVGTFTSSDSDVNAIHALILAAVRSNLQSILTDCPQREKLGWLETGHLLGRAMMFNFDLQSFYEQEVANMSDAQLATGLVPDIAPEFTVFAGGFRDSPEWGSAYVIDPWNVYQMYGDSALLAQNYAGMKRYVNYLNGKATGGLLAYGLGDWYDLGPAAPGVSQLTSAGVTATGILNEDATILQKAATLLGNTGDATQYAALATSTANAYAAKFWNGAAGYYDRNSQTANAVPLALGMVASASQTQAIGALVNSIVSAGYQVTAGDIGWAFVVPALSDAGRSDILLAMLKQHSAPGYLYQIAHGATSLTEAWSGSVADSQDHAMLGHAERWLWEGLAGIQTDEAGVGFQHFSVRPQTPVGIDSVTATFHSIRGPIASAWTRRGTGIELQVTVPVSAAATIYVPTAQAATVTESGTPVASARGITAVRPMTGAVAVDVGSGTYDFVAN
jgi:alpha-L-rhamnosidase